MALKLNLVYMTIHAARHFKTHGSEMALGFYSISRLFLKLVRDQRQWSRLIENYATDSVFIEV